MKSSSNDRKPEFELTQEVDGLLPENRWRRKMTLEELAENIAAWGEARGIITNGTAEAQCLKLGSEYGELCDNLAKGRYQAAKDDIGDMIVVLIMISEIIDTNLKECLLTAWDDIKDRKGYFNGKVFIKEGDDE